MQEIYEEEFHQVEGARRSRYSNCRMYRKKHLLYFNKVHCMIQGSRKEHSHGSQTRKELGRQCETEHRKDKKNKKNNKHNKNDGAGSSYMERLRSELFRKVWKYRKYRKYRNGSRKDKEGQEKELLPGNTSARIYKCYGT